MSGHLSEMYGLEVSSAKISLITDKLLPVITHSSKELAEHQLLELGEKWGKKYTAGVKSWSDHWDNFSQYFKYPEELRRIIYTTNIIEGVDLS